MRSVHLIYLSLLLLSGCLSTEPGALGGLPAGAEQADPGALLPQHHALAALGGDWRVEVASLHPRSGEALSSGAGTARISALHGGRILRLELELDLGGGLTLLTGHLGYDQEMGLWQAIWFSDSSTGMTLLEGRGELASGIHLHGERGGVSGRSVLEVKGPDMSTMEAYVPAAGGGDALLRRSSYFRM